MPKPTTTRRTDTSTFEPVSILEHFSLPGSERETKARTPKAAGPSIEDLQAQLVAMNTRLDEAQRTNTALMSQPLVTPQAPGNQPDIVVDTEGLPDPVTETAKYNTELAKRTLDAMRAQTARDREVDNQRQQTQNTYDQRANSLWEDFQVAYPAYSENDDRVRFVAESVATKARARGVDLDKYMFGPGRTQYMRDVAEQYEVMWPTNTEGDNADGGGNTDPGADQRPASRPQSQAPDRTGGIFGGAESGNKPNKPAANPGAPAPGSLSRDLQDLQRASGFF